DGDQSRHIASTYLYSGQTYTPDYIGIPQRFGDRHTVLYVEGINPGTTTLNLKVDPDGAGPEGWSLYDSCHVTVVSRTPTSLTSTVTNGNTVNLSWTSGKQDLTRGYNIYRSQTSNFSIAGLTPIATLTGPAGGTPPNT